MLGFQILVHCAPERREHCFKEIQELYEDEDDKFKQFMNYFKKQWLKNSFLDNLFAALNTEEDVEFIRSNNLCEVFHSFLAEFIKIKHGRASIVVSKLKEVELIFRRLMISRHLGNHQSARIPYSSTKLPIEKIVMFCREAIKSSHNYELRNIRKEPFWERFMELSQDFSRAVRMSLLKEETLVLEEEDQGNTQENDSSRAGTDSDIDHEDDADLL